MQGAPDLHPSGPRFGPEALTWRLLLVAFGMLSFRERHQLRPRRAFVPSNEVAISGRRPVGVNGPIALHGALAHGRQSLLRQHQYSRTAPSKIQFRRISITS
jgi:hypothetical protein